MNLDYELLALLWLNIKPFLNGDDFVFAHNKPVQLS